MAPFERMQTSLWVQAHLRTCHQAGVPALISRRGAEAGGLVLLRLNRPGSERSATSEARILSQTRTLDGALAWLPAGDGAWLEAEAADAYIDRAVARDPDLWVVEIDHGEGWHPFEGEEISKPSPAKAAAEALFSPQRRLR